MKNNLFSCFQSFVWHPKYSSKLFTRLIYPDACLQYLLYYYKHLCVLVERSRSICIQDGWYLYNYSSRCVHVFIIGEQNVYRSKKRKLFFLFFVFLLVVSIQALFPLIYFFRLWDRLSNGITIYVLFTLKKYPWLVEQYVLCQNYNIS